MKQEDLCPGSNEIIVTPGPHTMGFYDIERDLIRPRQRKHLKRIRMKCGKCGRRVLSSIKNDDSEIVHSIPEHKPKFWWKKKK